MNHITPSETDPSPYVWHPESLPVETLLNKNPRRVAEGVLLLGHFVNEGLANNAGYRDTGKVPLNTLHLRKIIGSRHLDRVRDVAQGISYVGRHRSYQAGHRSQEYEILPPYSDAPLIRRELADVAILHNLQRWRERCHRETWDRIRQNDTVVPREVVKYLRMQLQRVQVEGKVGNAVHGSQQIALEQIRQRRFRFSVDPFGRCHTSVTNLQTELREFLRVDGQRLVNVDVGESQPLMIGMVAVAAYVERKQNKSKQKAKQNHLLSAGKKEAKRRQRNERVREEGAGYHMLRAILMLRNQDGLVCNSSRDQLPSDLVRFLGLCEDRKLYSTIAEELSTTRCEAKPKVLASFYDKASHENRVQSVLSRLFPSVMDAMASLKAADYRHAAHQAQRLESGLMFGRIVPRIMAERPDLFIATIHDSILTTTGDEDFVRQAMIDEFARLGLSPTIHIDFC